MTESVEVRLFERGDVAQMCDLWNEVVRDGNAFPQEKELTEETGLAFFAEQSATAVAVRGEEVLGLYILHPNNVGRCGHIANASYAVGSQARGLHIGRTLVRDSLQRAGELGFTGLQFNAVVESNHAARHLYEALGFDHVGVIPGGFLMKDGTFEDIHIYYHGT